MVELLSCSLPKNKRLLGISFVLLVCLLMTRIIFTISGFLSVGLPMRIFMGINVLFVSLLPVIIVFIAADKMDLKTSFFLPFFIRGIVYPVCYAFFFNPFAMLGYPPYYAPYLLGGISLGLIGLAGNKFNTEFTKSMVFFTLGIAVMLLKAPNVIPIFYFVVTGDATPLLNIPELL
jgi:hypothetical protein